MTTFKKPALLSPMSIKNMPPVKWIVDRKIPRGLWGTEYGASRSMKTFGMIDLALSVATGKRWLEHYPIERDAVGPVVYIAAENSGGIRERMAAWLERRKMDWEDLEGKFYLLDEAPPMLEPQYIPLLIESITDACKPVLVIIDTSNRTLYGKNEDDNGLFGLYTIHVEQLIKATGATVIIVHHPPKGGAKTPRGADGLFSNAGFVHRWEGLGDNIHGHLVCEKMQSGSMPHDDIYFHLTPDSENVSATIQFDHEKPVSERRRSKRQEPAKPTLLPVGQIAERTWPEPISAAAKIDAKWEQWVIDGLRGHTPPPGGWSKNAIYQIVHRDRNKVLPAVDRVTARGILRKEGSSYFPSGALLEAA